MVPAFAAFAEEWAVDQLGDDTSRLTWRYGFETPGRLKVIQPVLAFGFKRQGARFLKGLADYMQANEAKYSD